MHTEPWWWLSFADGSLPEGEQFLGGLFLRGATLPGVITESHLRGLNPGGKVQAAELPSELEVPVKWAERLLSREEIAQMDEEMRADGPAPPPSYGGSQGSGDGRGEST